MKQVCLVFYTQKNDSSLLLKLPDRQFIPVQECYSYSALLSATGYMVWKFPYLPAPGIDKQVQPKFREETFPDRLAITHEMFNEWAYYFLDQLIHKNALRNKEILYLRAKVSAEYAERLILNGFQAEQINHHLTWKDIQQTLDESSLRSNKNDKNILILSCIDARKKKIQHHSSATLTGIYYNNENWKVFYIVEGQFPSQEDLDTASQIIVPGSSLNLSEERNQNIVKLIDSLRITLKTNKTLKYMGICFGHQLLSEVHRPQSVKKTGGSTGLNKITKLQDQSLQKYHFFRSFQKFNMTKTHKEEVTQLPEGFIKAAESERGHVEIMVSDDGRMLGFQGHPELSLQRWNSLESLDKMYKQNYGATEMLKMMDKEQYGFDQTLIVQELCRQFLGLE